MEERLKQEMDRCDRYGSKLTVVMVDLDHFKRINDGYGHTVGDKVLIGFAEILRSRARTADLVARYGGEEFVIIMPESDAQAASTYIRAVVDSLAAIQIETLEQPPTANRQFRGGGKVSASHLGTVAGCR